MTILGLLKYQSFKQCVVSSDSRVSDWNGRGPGFDPTGETIIFFVHVFCRLAVELPGPGTDFNSIYMVTRGGSRISQVRLTPTLILSNFPEYLLKWGRGGCYIQVEEFE